MLHSGSDVFTAPCNEWYATSSPPPMDCNIWHHTAYSHSLQIQFPSYVTPGHLHRRATSRPQSCANHSAPFVFPLTLALMCGCWYIASGAVDIGRGENGELEEEGGKTEVGIKKERKKGDVKWLEQDRWLNDMPVSRVMHKLRSRLLLLLLFLFLCTPACSSEWITYDPPSSAPHVCLPGETDCTWAT